MLDMLKPNPKTLEDIAERLRDIDICMFTTISEDGMPATRPMSNNRDVDYDGTSYYFTSDEQEIVNQIEGNTNVALGFQSGHFYASVGGEAELIRDKGEMLEHWNSDLDRWFEQGIDTPGIVMICVTGRHLKWWQKMDSGEIDL